MDCRNELHTRISVGHFSIDSCLSFLSISLQSYSNTRWEQKKIPDRNKIDEAIRIKLDQIVMGTVNGKGIKIYLNVMHFQGKGGQKLI